MATATPLTMVSSDRTIAASGRCSREVARSAAAPASVIATPSTRVPFSDHDSASRPARKPNTMNPAELRPNANE